MVAVGAGQQEACLRVGWPDDNPPLGPAIVGERRRIVDKFESKDTSEELDRRVIVVNDDGDQFQKRHRRSLPRARDVPFTSTRRSGRYCADWVIGAAATSISCLSEKSDAFGS